MTDREALLARLSWGVAAASVRDQPLPTRLCRSVADILGCDGGAITLAYTRPERVTLCVTDEIARQLEELQDLLGEGPAAEAFQGGAYVALDLTPGRLAVPGSSTRWPVFEPVALPKVGPVGVHALPMKAAKRVVGVMTLYQQNRLTTLPLAEAQFLSDAVAAALLVDAPTQLQPGRGLWSERAEVHQANGMVMAQLGIGGEDALALMRAHAFSHDQNLGATAHDIIERLVTFSASVGHGIEST